MKKAQNADKHVDVSTGLKGYKQAVSHLSAAILASVGADLLSETADIAVAARKLEMKMKATLTNTIEKVEQGLRAAISTAETTREWSPLAAYLKPLVADEVLRESCGGAIESAEDLVSTLQAEDEGHTAAVSVYVSRSIRVLLF